MTENTREKIEQLTFEEAIERLETVVHQLEDGEVPLEQAIELFQEGMTLSKQCSEKLDSVESRIEMLIEENGEWVKKPLAPEED
ncbi:exodeoxyribonuclease VII small subunit [Numidum massiliense]|uniref:exodeoxyribonuclease VII small subunit n=1 Tax=Numidum massiliense TaxID=1522315 RepID=UPI0006D56CFD|nr:exodeoxyribonuclease VII small subunit [Numidum massiliense]